MVNNIISITDVKLRLKFLLLSLLVKVILLKIYIDNQQVTSFIFRNLKNNRKRLNVNHDE